MKSEPVQMVKRTLSTDFSWVTGNPAGLQDRLAKHLIGKIPPGAVCYLSAEDGNYGGETLTVTYESPETPKEVAAREQLAKKRAAKIMQKEETERALLAELKKKYEETQK